MSDRVKNTFKRNRTFKSSNQKIKLFSLIPQLLYVEKLKSISKIKNLNIGARILNQNVPKQNNFIRTWKLLH